MTKIEENNEVQNIELNDRNNIGDNMKSKEKNVEWEIDKKIVLPSKDNTIEVFFLLKEKNENILSEDKYVFLSQNGYFLNVKDMKKNLKNVKVENINIDKVRIFKNIKNIMLMDDSVFEPKDGEIEILKMVSDLKEINEKLSQQIKLLNPNNSPSGFLDYYAFKKHVLLQGPKGTSKSYQSFKFIADNKLEHEVMIGHNSIEAMDFLGHFIQTQNGLAWKDGALTAAFRKAQKHGKAVLLIDEMLRIPEKELNVIIGSLSPDYEGNFVLRTGRALGVNSDGFAEEEVLKIPMNSLFVIATTNVGAGYQVYRADEALLDRFRILNINMTHNEFAKIIDSEINKKGFSSLTKTMILNLFDSLKNAFNMSELTKLTNLRQMVESIQMADNEEMIKKNILDLVGNMVEVDIDGEPNKQQKHTYMEIVNRIMN